MKINTAITIGRNSIDEVHIRIECENSNTEFVDVCMSYEEFAKALTGLSYVHCRADVRGLDKVGKVKVQEKRSVEYPLSDYSKEDMQKWLIDTCQEDGWTLNPYLGSQTSTVRLGGKVHLNYSVYKYVEETK